MHLESLLGVYSDSAAAADAADPSAAAATGKAMEMKLLERIQQRHTSAHDDNYSYRAGRDVLAKHLYSTVQKRRTPILPNILCVALFYFCARAF
jgi:hypothetical protein